jgi:speckle-type POZ protein
MKEKTKGKEVPMHQDSKTASFESGSEIGFRNFATVNALSRCTTDDTLTIRVYIELNQRKCQGDCVVTENGDVTVSTVATCRVGHSLLNLLADGGLPHNVWLQSESSGCEKTVEKVGAHKFMLAALSTVFHAMFYGEMKEAHSCDVLITDFTAGALKAFVRFLYTDSCSRDALSQHAEELLVIADKYEVLALVTVCECYLASVLAPDNAVSLLKLADTHNAAQLRAQALSFIVDSAALTAKHAQELSLELVEDLLRAVAEKSK